MSANAAPVSRRIFVTGATGVVGRELLAVLENAGHAVRGLSRTVPRAGEIAPWDRDATPVVVGGELATPDPWRPALAGADAVVHLAARTGKASARQHHDTNVGGTRKLLETCSELGVPRFLFASSIAAGFPDRPAYPYARSKRAAEALVAASGLSTTIVRPTIVVGAGSGSLAGLARLASLPVLPLIGGARAPVQPIWVGDLARQLATILAADRFAGETLALGGPETLPIGDLLRRIRRRGGREERAMRIPATPVLALLEAAERVLGPALPVTAGQLASFVHDGAAGPNPLADPDHPMLAVDEMLRAAGVGCEGSP